MSPATKNKIELVYNGFIALISGYLIGRVISGEVTPYMLIAAIPACILSTGSFAKRWDSL